MASDMEQFIQIYLIIGLTIFMFLTSAMYIIGFENVVKEVKELEDSSEFTIVMGILIFSLILWPLIVYWTIQQNFR